MARNFRRLVACETRRAGAGRGRRPAVWAPGETLVIDWGEQRIVGCELHVFCAVLAWSRFRFARFATDEKRPCGDDWTVKQVGSVGGRVDADYYWTPRPDGTRDGSATCGP